MIKNNKKILHVKNLFKYKLGIFMNNLLPVNFKYCFKILDKVHNRRTRSSKTNVFLLRFYTKYGHKSAQ